MATRSAIGVVHSDGTVSAIYCHWDGYPSGVGRTLAEHYTDPSKIDDLLMLGDLSILGSEIGSQHDFDARFEDSDLRANWCRAYGRDRGEEGCHYSRFSSPDEFVSEMSGIGCEYFYLWKNDQWHVWGAKWALLDLEEMAA